MMNNPHIAQRQKSIVERPIFFIGIIVLCLLVVVAIVKDSRSFANRKPPYIPDVPTDLKNLHLHLDGPRVKDPKGYFSMVEPYRWKRVSEADCKPYNLVFFSINGPDISIMATPVAYNTLPELFKEIQQSEVQAGMASDMETTKFQGRPAIRRTAKLARVRVLAYDFIVDKVAYHILCTMPHEVYEKYEPVLMDLLNTFEATKPAGEK